MNQSEHVKWVEDYIRAQELGGVDADHPLWWAIARFFDLGETDPEACWQAILEIVQRQPSEQILGVLSAGPLEDLIEEHGLQFIDRIEDEARKSPVFRRMLRSVWESSSDDVWARVQRASELS
ncbi:MAG: hypothetical protein H0T88_00730 [Lysobacter sp.]|nr:hypothetical protein [Lysobacter sp.]